NPEQTYGWTVQAFAANDPDSTSDKATPFWFTTASDDFTQTVFEDTFDEDRGWADEGDALTGAWVRGSPVRSVHDVQIAPPDDADSTSDKATPFWFTTASDDFTQTVFEDTFDEDRGWAVEGDALTGAWVRGNPVMTVHDGQIAQPDDCAGGQSCYFTGQNPDAIVVEEDVSEGTTALV